MQAVYFVFQPPEQCCPSTSQPASQQRVSDDRWGEYSRTDLGSGVGPCLLLLACQALPSRVASLQRVSRQHSHQILDPPFTTPRLPNIITHTPTIRTLDNSKWLAAKVRSSPSRRRAACARGPTCRTALTQSSTGKTGGKTGGKAGGDSTGKTQKSHSAKAGLQVCDTQS